MSLASRICGVQLKKVQTKVTTADGKMWVESRLNDTFFARIVENCDQFGFVVDNKPDLQLAEISSGVFIGSQDVAENLKILHGAGITHVLNLTPNVENFYPCEFIYKRVPILDMPDFDLLLVLSNCSNFIEKSLACNNGKILVHCNAGISRSAAVVTAFLMQKRCISYADALKIIKNVKPCVKPNDGFEKQLKSWNFKENSARSTD